MTPVRAYRPAKRLRLAARIIALIITIFGAVMVIGTAAGELSSQGFITASLEGGLLVVIGLVALAGCILSWRRDRLPGILLVVTSAGLGAHIGVFAERNHLIVWAMIGLPYLLAGALLLYAWWRSASKIQA